MSETDNTESQVQSNDQAAIDVDALYDSIMKPTEEPRAPSDGVKETESISKEPEGVKADQGTTSGDLFTLKHKDFENGERQFERDKVIEYAQKGFDYELKMHQFKKDRQAYEEQMREFESSRNDFDQTREYWKNVDQYMKDNPGFADVVRSEFAKIQGQQGYEPISPATQALQNQIQELQARLDAKDTEAQEKSQSRAEERFVKSTIDYKREHADFDWEAKDEFGQTLQERIEEHAVKNEFKNFKDAANAYLFDQHLKRAAIKAKEEAAKDLQKQRKLGLGPITDHSTKTATQARSVSQLSYEDLAREGLADLGIDI